MPTPAFEGARGERRGERRGCTDATGKSNPAPSAARVPGRGRVGRFRLAAHRASNPSHGLVQIARDGGGDIFEVRRGGGGGDVVAENRRGLGSRSSRSRSNDSRHGRECFSEFLGARLRGVRLASARATASAFSWSSRNISPLAASFSRASRNRSRVSSISSLSFAVSSASTSRRRASSRRNPSAGSAPSATYRSHSSANARFAASADSARNARSSASRRSRATSDVPRRAYSALAPLERKTHPPKRTRRRPPYLPRALGDIPAPSWRSPRVSQPPSSRRRHPPGQSPPPPVASPL